MNKIDTPDTVCFDFDGVIATYDGWKGFDILGDPVPEVINAMKQLKKEGYSIVIWTGRQDTPILRKWLTNNEVPYDELNRNSHNPPCTSSKPYFKTIVDDRAVNFSAKNNRLSTEELVKQIKAMVTMRNTQAGDI